MVGFLAVVAPDDATRIAADLIDQFGNVSAILTASRARLCRALPDCEAAAVLLGAAGRLAREAGRARICDRPLLGTFRDVVTYLRISLAHAPIERCHVLYLSATNHLIQDAIISEGSVDTAPLQPRAVLSRALDVGATALIVAHNHPSGNARPSKADVNVTKRLCTAAAALDISLHDHIVVTRTGHTSLRELGLL